MKIACFAGAIAESTEYGSKVVLPSGHEIVGVPHETDAYRETAERLGYGCDTLAMCQDHDVLHCMFCDWLGLPNSFSMQEAAGIADDSNAAIALAEEEAVLAIQKFMRLSLSRPLSMRANADTY